MQCYCNDLTLREKGALCQNRNIIVKSSLVCRSDESDAMSLQWSYIAGKRGFASKSTQKCDPWSRLLLEPGPTNLTEVKVVWLQASFHIFMVRSFNWSSTLLLIQKLNSLNERFFCVMILRVISISLVWCWWGWLNCETLSPRHDAQLALIYPSYTRAPDESSNMWESELICLVAKHALDCGHHCIVALIIWSVAWMGS
jgi:hypothetical protein